MIWCNKAHLKIDDSKTIWLPSSLHTLLELEDIVIVVVKAEEDEEMNKVGVRNVFAYDRKGNLLWQIQKQKKMDYRVHEYDSVYLKDDKVMVGATWGGEYYLDTKDGSITPAGGRPW